MQFSPKYVLLIDGNFFLYRTFFLMKSILHKNKKIPFLTYKDDQKEFLKKLLIDINFVLKQFQTAEQIIITQDSSSWRKNFYKPYKAIKKKEEDINWQKLYEIYDEFLKILKNNGIIISSIDYLEGDDLLYLWSEFFKKNNRHCIIISGDSDLYQLVSSNDGIFKIFYNNQSNKNIIVVEKNFLKNLKEQELQYSSRQVNRKDIFNLDDDLFFQSNFYQLMDEVLQKTNLKIIEPIKILVSKIFLGDKQDNVPNVYSWIDEKTKKIKKITTQSLEKLIIELEKEFKEISASDFLNNETLQNFIINFFERYFKIQIDKEQFLQNLEMNLKLVYLNYKCIPKEYIIEFKKFLNENKKILKQTLYTEHIINSLNQLIKNQYTQLANVF